MLFIDYSSAFNTIVPSKLITKLRTLVLNIYHCNWILDFLTGHSLAVRVGNNTSAILTINIKSNQILFVTYTWLADVNASVAKCLCF